MPTLGIAIPVYNSENSIEKILDCVMQQTYQDFDVHIFDNNSTDSTFEKIVEYSKKYSNIYFHKNSINIGMAENFNNCLNIKNFADYKYISIKSSNDFIQPTYYEKCIEFLENNSDYCLCYTEGTNTINGPQEIYSYEQDDIFERIKSILKYQGVGNMNYGVYRADIIDKLSPIQPIQGFDHVFFLNLVILGKLKKLDEVLYDRTAPVTRTKESYQKACCSTISNNIYKIPHFVELFIGYIDFCNSGYIANLNKEELISFVVDTLFEVREKLYIEHYLQFREYLDNEKELANFDFIELKQKLDKMTFCSLKNNVFRKWYIKHFNLQNDFGIKLINLKSEYDNLLLNNKDIIEKIENINSNNDELLNKFIELSKQNLQTDNKIENLIKTTDYKISQLSNQNIQVENKIEFLSENLKTIDLKSEMLSSQNIELFNKIDYIIKKLEKPTFIQQIFSVRNEKENKIIRVLGIKIKLKGDK